MTQELGESEALREAALIAASAIRLRNRQTVSEAARSAWTPTGPSLAELTQEISARRYGAVELSK